MKILQILQHHNGYFQGDVIGVAEAEAEKLIAEGKAQLREVIEAVAGVESALIAAIEAPIQAEPEAPLQEAPPEEPAAPESAASEPVAPAEAAANPGT